MRKHLVLSLSFLLVLVLATALSAATADKTTTTAKTTTAKTTTAKSSATKYHRMHGDIASIDTATQSFTVKHGKDTSTFKTDSATKYRGMGKVIGFADLQVGDDVRVSYTEVGSDKTAARVDVAHTKKATATKSKPS
jgi:hypothetical protein